MAGMTKLILLMTLVAVFFVPQDGLGADGIKCHRLGGAGAEGTVNCPPPHFCSTQTRNDGGQTTKGCTDEVQEKDPSFTNKGKDDCGDLLDGTGKKIGKRCFCKDKDLCNSIGRLHGQPSSVLSLCVISIFLATFFFGKT